MKKRKQVCNTKDEVLTEFKVLLKVNLKDLGLNGEIGSLKEIENKLMKLLSTVIEFSVSENISPVLYNLKVLENTITTKSYPKDIDTEGQNLD